MYRGEHEVFFGKRRGKKIMFRDRWILLQAGRFGITPVHGKVEGGGQDKKKKRVV